jgi:hypothetical protein
MDGPFINAARERFRENHPIAAAVADSVRAADAAGTPPTAEAIQDAIDRDPVAQNAANREPLRNSRTFMGNIIAFVGWLLLVLQFLNGDRTGAEQIVLNLPEIAAMVAAIAGHGIGVIGRTVKNLPPINWRRPLTAIGIGR